MTRRSLFLRGGVLLSLLGFAPLSAQTSAPAPAASPIPAGETVIDDVPRDLMSALQLSRPTAKTPRGWDSAQRVVLTVMTDEKIDAAEQAVLRELAQPGHRLRLRQRAADGPSRELVYTGTFQPEARELLQRFVPPPGVTTLEMPPETRRAFWISTGPTGWSKALDQARADPAGRREILDVLVALLAEKAARSDLANRYQPIRDELARWHTFAASLSAAEFADAKQLIYTACVELDRATKDALPDYLYSADKPPA